MVLEGAVDDGYTGPAKEIPQFIGGSYNIGFCKTPVLHQQTNMGFHVPDGHFGVDIFSLLVAIIAIDNAFRVILFGAQVVEWIKGHAAALTVCITFHDDKLYLWM
jgi:hypothetical protein